MKRYGYLFDKICDVNNIELAIMNASKGKRNRATVRNIVDNKEHYAIRIKWLLENNLFKPSPYRQFTIKDGSSQKEREIFCLKFFPDQIVHWSIIQVIQPILDQPMYELSCGSRKGKGAHYGMKFVKRWIHNDVKNTKYCLKMDIRKFYPSIDQNKLEEMLSNKFKDKKLLNLLYLIIESVGNGVPIGNYTSQWFANYYLTPLDHFVKEKLGAKYYVRYMDDLVIFGKNKKKLHHMRREISKFLKEYGLELKDNWQVFLVDDRGIDFMGYRFFRTKTTLRKRMSLRIRRRVRKVKQTYHYACMVMSYLGWLTKADMYIFVKRCVLPYIDIKELKEVIRNENRKQCKTCFAI